MIKSNLAYILTFVIAFGLIMLLQITFIIDGEASAITQTDPFLKHLISGIETTILPFLFLICCCVSGNKSENSEKKGHSN